MELDVDGFGSTSVITQWGDQWPSIYGVDRNATCGNSEVEAPTTKMAQSFQTTPSDRETTRMMLASVFEDYSADRIAELDAAVECLLFYRCEEETDAPLPEPLPPGHVERRIVLVLPKAVDDDVNTVSAATMGAHMRHMHGQLCDLGYRSTTLELCDYYQHLWHAYDFVPRWAQHVWGGPSDCMRTPRVYVEDLLTGDNRVLLKKARFEKTVEYAWRVRMGAMDAADVPKEFDAALVFRGVRLHSSFAETPLEPLAPEVLCRVRGVPVAHAAEEVAKFKTVEARFEEHEMARAYI